MAQLAMDRRPNFIHAQSPALGSKRIIVFSADEPDKKANAALLMALYAVSCMLRAVNI